MSAATNGAIGTVAAFGLIERTSAFLRSPQSLRSLGIATPEQLMMVAAIFASKTANPDLMNE